MGDMMSELEEKLKDFARLGAFYAGRMRLTSWGDGKAGHRASFRLVDREEDGTPIFDINPFKGCYSDPKNGDEYLAVLIAVGKETAQIEAPKEKREWKDLSHTEQAGILCSTDNFQLYLSSQRSILWDDAQKNQLDPTSSDLAAYCIRNICGVTSRKDIKRENTAGAKFRHLCAEYFEWKDKQC